MRKNIVALTLFVLIISACSPTIKEETSDASTTKEETTNTSNEEETPDDGMLQITLAELKMYDGSNGNPAYIAIDGIIYDVTNIPNWNGGSHNGFEAGNDLSKEMKEISPHGVSKLKLVEAVGEIID